MSDLSGFENLTGVLVFNSRLVNHFYYIDALPISFNHDAHFPLQVPTCTYRLRT